MDKYFSDDIKLVGSVGSGNNNPFGKSAIPYQSDRELVPQTCEWCKGQGVVGRGCDQRKCVNCGGMGSTMVEVPRIVCKRG